MKNMVIDRINITLRNGCQFLSKNLCTGTKVFTTGKNPLIKVKIRQSTEIIILLSTHHFKQSLCRTIPSLKKITTNLLQSSRQFQVKFRGLNKVSKTVRWNLTCTNSFHRISVEKWFSSKSNSQLRILYHKYKSKWSLGHSLNRKVQWLKAPTFQKVSIN